MSSVIMVCTGNICRSPMAEALLARSLADWSEVVAVESAGTLEVRRPAAPETVAVMAKMGIDLSAHISRPVTAAMLADADLVVGMTREHVRTAALLDPACLPRAFTLAEVVRRGERYGGPRDGETIRLWAERLSGSRAHAELLGSARHDDIADPIGGTTADFEVTAAIIADLTQRLAVFLRAAA